MEIKNINIEEPFAKESENSEENILVKCECDD